MPDFAATALLSASPWKRVTFTTYALSLSFFEAVVLDALTRGKAQETTILADVHGVRAALGEQGARRAGRDYQIEPVSVAHGVFHPKVTILSSDDDCHLLVGSGNLTFGGWGGNLETIDHLHPSFAATAFADAAEFFTQLASSADVHHDALPACRATAEDLRRATRGRAANEDIRLLHNLDGPISVKLANIADSLGGASRLVVAAPFWSAGALDELCSWLGLTAAFVHRHPHGLVHGRFGSNWPYGAACTVNPVQVDELDDGDNKRSLHLKLYELLCRNGRIVVSGSVNATAAALTSSRNVEVCIARIERTASAGWSLVSATAPEPMQGEDENDDEQNVADVLKAVLVAEQIKGQVLGSKMRGPARVYQVTADTHVELGGTTIHEGGKFDIAAPHLEIMSWKGGRLIIRVEQVNGQAAEGFVSVASYNEIKRRVGALAPRLFAVISGTETPADVAAIMSWFHENPKVLPTALPISASGTRKDDGSEGAKVSVADLLHPAAPPPGSPDEHGHGGGRAWERFMNNLIASIREPRQPFGKPNAGRSRGSGNGNGDGDDDDEEGGNGSDEDQAQGNRETEKLLASFERLFDQLMSEDHCGAYDLVAFDLTQYIVERLEPDARSVETWLRALVRGFCRHDAPGDRLGDIVAATLVLHSVGHATPDEDRATRSCLFQWNIDLTQGIPDLSGARAFVRALAPSTDFEYLWQRLQQTISFPEQVGAYLRALAAKRPSHGYPDLPIAAADCWPTLEAAISDDEMRSEILLVARPMPCCPKCYISLTPQDASDLEAIGVALARNCCRRVLVLRGN